MAVTQKAPLASTFGDAVSDPAWKHRPSWYQLSRHDRMIAPENQQAMAARMQPKRLLELDASHASLASKPAEVTALILKPAPPSAAEAAQRTTAGAQGSTLLRLRPPGRIPIPSSRRQRIPLDRGGPVVLSVPVVRISPLSLRRRLLPQALAQSLLIAALASSASAAAQSTADRDAATQAPTSQTLQTVQVTANQLGTITEGSGAYTPGTIATATRLVLTRGRRRRPSA